MINGLRVGLLASNWASDMTFLWVILASFTVVGLCFAYVLKEWIRRKKNEKSGIHEESNYRITDCLFAVSVSLIFITAGTIFTYLARSRSYNFWIHLVLFVIFDITAVVAFLFSRRRVIINRATGTIISIGYLFSKRINVQDITSIKCLKEGRGWSAYVNGKKVFSINFDTETISPSFEYYVLRHANCETDLRGYDE